MSSIFDSGSDPLAALAQDMSAQKAQLAQYAIQSAAKFMQNSNYDGAVKEFKKALALDPQNETAQTYLGKIYLSQNKNDEAIKIYKSYAQQQPLSVNAQVNLGNAYLQNKQYSESEIAFKKASRLDPLNPVAAYTLGQQYLATDRLGEAEAQFQKTLKIAPKDGNVYYALGAVYNKMGRSEDAARNLEQSLNLKKNFPSANYELGVAYANLGNTDKAQAQYNILKSSSYSLANDLKFVMEKPKIVSMNTSKGGGFVELMGPRTPLWALDPALMTPSASKQFSVTFQFSNEMNMASVVNPSNWSITRGKSAQAGYYNDYMPVTSKEVSIPKMPLSVTFNAVTREATINFRISQNASGDATIDPKHLVFAFKGKDSAGRSMDSSADQINGYALKAF